MMRDGGRIDGLSVHYYTVPRIFRDKGPATGFPESEWAIDLAHALHIDDIVTQDRARSWTNTIRDKKVGLYVDEWGSWYDPGAGQPSRLPLSAEQLRDAEVAALTLNIFHRHTDRVKLAATSPR